MSAIQIRIVSWRCVVPICSQIMEVGSEVTSRISSSCPRNSRSRRVFFQLWGEELGTGLPSWKEKKDPVRCKPRGWSQLEKKFSTSASCFMTTKASPLHFIPDNQAWVCEGPNNVVSVSSFKGGSLLEECFMERRRLPGTPKAAAKVSSCCCKCSSKVLPIILRSLELLKPTQFCAPLMS